MNDDPAMKARLQAVIIEGRRRVEARRRAIADLKHAALSNDGPQQGDASADATEIIDDCIYDAAFEARLFADIGEWLKDDQFRVVKLDDLMKMGEPESNEKGENKT